MYSKSVRSEILVIVFGCASCKYLEATLAAHWRHTCDGWHQVRGIQGLEASDMASDLLYLRLLSSILSSQCRFEGQSDSLVQ